MSSAFKTLTTSDFTVLPYKALKSLTYPSCSVNEADIRVYRGVNVPQTITGSLSQESIYYSTIKNAYYTYQISASFASSSAYDDSNQSTAATGSYQSDVRNLPLATGSIIKILSIPQSIYGETVSPKTFKLRSATNAYYIVDDGNGNLVDIIDCINKLTAGSYDVNDYPDSVIYNTDLLYQCAETGSLVGNIIYPQGVAIITNSDYNCVFDLGPTTYDVAEVFLTTDDPKVITPLVTTVVDCSALIPDSLELIPIPGSVFPDYVNAGGEISLDNSDPLFSTVGTYEIDYKVKSASCTISNISKITVDILNCDIIGGTVTILATVTPTPTPTLTPSVTPTNTITPTVTATPGLTPSVTPTNTITPTITPTSTTGPAATPTPTTTITPTRTPSPTPTPTEAVTFSICAQKTGNYEVTWSVFANGAVPDTDVILTLNLLVDTGCGLQLYQGLTTTVLAGNWNSVLNYQNTNCIVSSVINGFFTNINPTSYSNQVYTASTLNYFNMSCPV